MKIIDRIKGITEVEDVYWDSHKNRLVVYYQNDMDVVRVKVASALRDACLQDSIDEITLISTNRSKTLREVMR